MELPTDRETWLRVERIRLGWEQTTRDSELAKSLLLQGFAILVSAALAAVAAVLADRSPALPSLALASLMLVGAGILHGQLRRVKRDLRRAADVAIGSIGRLMEGDGE